MTTHSSIRAWRIPWTEEPRGLWSIGSQRVGHDLNNLAHIAHRVGSVKILHFKKRPRNARGYNPIY